jgi:hypothetical protein
MISKYDIEHIVSPNHKTRADTLRTNDPLEVVDFIATPLTAGALIHAINHEGGALSQAQSDRMIHVAAERLVSGLLRASLKLDAPEVKHSFGFAA